jgi:hypothetical protein
MASYTGAHSQRRSVAASLPGPGRTEPPGDSHRVGWAGDSIPDYFYGCGSEERSHRSGEDPGPVPRYAGV